MIEYIVEQKNTFRMLHVTLKRILFALLLVAVNVLHAANPYYFQIDKSKQLPSNTIFDITQDSKGFVWLTGNKGLYRYDGKRFKNFAHSNQGSRAGSNIQEDKYGRIWYQTFDGAIYYTHGDTLRRFIENAMVGYLKFGIIDNTAYVVEKDSVKLYNINNLQQVKAYDLGTNNVVASIVSKNEFYVLSETLFVINEKSMRKITLPHDIMYQQIGPMLVNTPEALAIYWKSKKQVYHYIKNDKVEARTLHYKGAYVQNAIFTNNENWICTTAGLFRYDFDNNILLTPKLKMADVNVSTVLKDRFDNYWVGSLRNGVYFIPDFDNAFFPDNDIPSSIAFATDFFVTGNAHEAIHKQTFTSNAKELLFANNSNHDIYFLWADTVQHKIFATSDSFRMLNYKGKLLMHNSMALKSITPIDNGLYAFAATGFCGIIGHKNNEAMIALNHSNQNVKDSDYKIHTLISNIRGKAVAFHPKSKRVYFAGNVGLFVYDNKQLREVKLNGKSLNLNHLAYADNQIFAISSNGILLSIDEKGAIRTVAFRGISPDASANRIKALDGRLFLISTSTIYEYFFDTGLLRRIITVHPDYEISDLALSDKKMIVATTKGYIVLDKNFQPRSCQYDLVINEILANESPVTFEQLSNLKHDQNDIKIDISVLSYDPTAVNLLYYRINGNEWKQQEADNQFVELRNLAPGKYNVDFLVINESAHTPRASINFVILPPFWLRWWFILIAIIIFSISMYRFDRWKTARINRKSSEIIERIELEKTANQSRLQALKSQMNPHFFFNALNTVQSYILENDKRMALNFLNKFSVLTRSILEMSDRDDTTVAEEIKVLQLYLDIEKVRFGNDFEYSIEHEGFEPEMLKIPTLLLQPYVENAMKHGLLHKEGLKRLRISFALTNNFIRIIIDDNGIGRQKSMELNKIRRRGHVSFATEAIKKRVELLNQMNGEKISVEYFDETNQNGQSGGTTVVLKIPLKSQV